jgi:hypothetical protein
MKLPALLLLLPLGCELAVPTTVTETPHDSEPSSPLPRDSGDTGDPGQDTEPNPFERDDDGDGYSENQGDCDDGDPSLHPDQPDPCNGIDDDCDGVLDEDAAGEDIYEPNDEAWFYLGSLADEEHFSVTGVLHNDDDDDRFSFYIDDPWYSSFGFQVSVSSIPADATYRLQVGRLADDGSLTEIQSSYGAVELSLAEEGEGGVDDAGTYGVIVDAVGGADCGRSYLLTITEG